MKDKRESTSSDKSSQSSNPSRSLYKEPDMGVNHVVGLKATNNFNEGDKVVHIEHNRVLQEGFLSGSPVELLKMIERNYPRNTDAWTTNFIQPTPKAALMLNIAADLIVSYQVSVDSYQSVMEQAYQIILNNDPHFEAAMQQQISDQMQGCENIINERKDELIHLFKENTPPGLKDESMTKDARALAELSIGKHLTNRLVQGYVATHLPQIMHDLHIAKKPIFPIGKNHDMAILGAAGSGKSHLLRTR